MKVIAYLDPGYMVSITKEELALVMGYRGQHSDGFKKHFFHNGDDIPISSINQTAEFVRNINVGKLQQLRSSLSSAIERVDVAEDIVNQINLFEKLKENHNEKP